MLSETHSAGPFFHVFVVFILRLLLKPSRRFKLQTRLSSAHIYPLLHSPSWIFDCELLLLASLSSIPTSEVGIQWKEVDGSKVDLIKDSIRMAIDLLVVRGNYWLGRWRKPAVIKLSTEPSSREKKKE